LKPPSKKARPKKAASKKKMPPSNKAQAKNTASKKKTPPSNVPPLTVPPAQPPPTHLPPGAVVRAIDPVRNSAGAALHPVVNAECLKMLEVIRERCPGVLPAAPVPPGQVAAVLPVDQAQLRTLLTVSAAVALGAPMTADKPAPVVWTDGSAELLVDPSGVTLDTGDGIARIRVPVRCNETGPVTVTVTFAVGSTNRPAGFVAATHSRPDGPEVIVARWGEAIVALAWHSLITASAGLAGVSGADADGQPFVPAGIQATPQGIAIHTMPRPAYFATAQSMGGP
jgi:hypothetical protein